MSFLASMAAQWGGRASARRFAAAAQDPRGAQERKLREILERNRDTEYGRAHGFAGLRSLADYAARVPVVTYDDLAADMDRVARGAKNVFTADDPLMFARTSGTSGTPKLIPVTRTCQDRDHRDQMRTWLYHARRAHPAMLRGKVLSLVSPAVEGHTQAGIPFGSTSGQIYRSISPVIRRTYAIPYEVFTIGDYDARYYVLMRIGLTADVTFLCTANPSSIVKLCEVADENADRLLRDVADGTLAADLELPDEIRAAVLARCRRAPARARRLERARARRGRLLPVDYWPNLALIGCWKGGTVGSYVDRFPDWFAADDRPLPPVRDWGYLSSEARCSIPLADEGTGGVLTVATNVYEFVPLHELEAAPDDPRRWTCLGVDDLVEGEDYYVLLTTTGGLYRYHIDDVLHVDGCWHRTPVVSFRRKGKDITNITGEKVSANQVLQAVHAAAAAQGLHVAHCKAEADVAAACYRFAVEAAGGVPEERRVPLLEAIDRELARLNPEYAGKRDSQRLHPPVLLLMRPGWYDRQTRAQVRQGKRAFQWKPPVLALRREEDQAATDGDVVAEVVLEQARP